MVFWRLASARRESGRMVGHVLCRWVEGIGDDSRFLYKLISLDILNSVCSFVCYDTTSMYRDDRSYEVCASGITYFWFTSSLVRYTKMI